MPRRGAVALVTTTLAVLLLFGFKTSDPGTPVGNGPSTAIIGDPTPTQQPGSVAVTATPVPTARSNGGSSASTPTPTPTAPAQAGGGTSGTFTGNLIRTPYGPVQVAIVVKGGKITDVQELQLPSDRRLSQQISDYAGPILRSQTLSAQSANINGVSGASYTSEGFYESLQSALAQER